jgi:hypothetical protein
LPFEVCQPLIPVASTGFKIAVALRLRLGLCALLMTLF